MRQAEPNSPRISHLSWGRIEVEDYLPFKDVKIFPGGAREWDWRETGTRHVPGIQPADVQELIEHGKEWDTVDGQLEFIAYELCNGFRGIGRALIRAKTAKEAREILRPYVRRLSACEMQVRPDLASRLRA